MDIDANMRIIDKGNLVAAGELVIDGIFKISQVKVLNLPKADKNPNWVVLMPRKKTTDGWSNAVFIQDEAIKQLIRDKVFESIRKELTKDLGLEQHKFSVKITPYKKGNMLGYASVCYDDALEFQNIQIRKDGNKGGIRLVFPYNLSDKQYQPLVNTLTQMVRDKITEEVEAEYNRSVHGLKEEKQTELNREQKKQGGYK